MEDAVLKQRHETELKCPMTEAFAALVDVVGKGRWSGATLTEGGVQPRPGCQYAQQRGRVLRRGKVLAYLRPVSITLQEMLLDPPCCVQLRLHWRLEPIEDGSCVFLDARFLLNGAATLRRRHWQARISGHCTRMLGALEQRVLGKET
jgi:hypothetical protein